MLHKNRVAVVTGAASGIGRAAALAFSREGAGVTVADVNSHDGNAVADEINSNGGRALFVETDVTVENQVKEMINRTVEEFGGVDCAFNNAGSPGQYCTVVTCEEDAWNRIISINMTGIMYCMKYEIPEILNRGGGAIVNTASRAGDSAAANLFAYTTTKHAIVGMTRATAVDFAGQNVRVNAIMPGTIDTPMLRTAVEGMGLPMEQMSAPIPMQRIGEAHEPAEAAVWLCSDRAGYITGSTLVIDGGQRASIY